MVCGCAAVIRPMTVRYRMWRELTAVRFPGYSPAYGLVSDGKSPHATFTRGRWPRFEADAGSDRHLDIPPVTKRVLPRPFFAHRCNVVRACPVRAFSRFRRSQSRLVVYRWKWSCANVSVRGYSRRRLETRKLHPYTAGREHERGFHVGSFPTDTAPARCVSPCSTQVAETSTGADGARVRGERRRLRHCVT
jgi:hypothetical protein